MRYANAAAVRAMLQTFFRLDDREGMPEDFFPNQRPGKVGQHTLRLGPSLRYRLGDGYLIRHLWSEQDFSLIRPYTAIVAAGYFAHAEAVLGVGCVRQVDFWHLRSGKVKGWQAKSLLLYMPTVHSLLDNVADQLGPTQ